uniref:Putative plant transposon protein domain-containing protein n=1 Tax=Solanum tuberosum TaxID=4113 RepID=M1DN20_SOLTU
MAGPNEENLTFVRFPDIVSRERHHDNINIGFYCERGFLLLKLEEKAHAFYARLMEFEWTPLTEAPPNAHFTWGVYIPLNATAINEALKLPKVLNVEYEAKLWEMDLGWLRNTLIKPVRRDQVYWSTTDGITSSDWSPDAKRWLHLVTRRIRPSGNRTDVTFPLALVVAKKAFFLPGLITALCKPAGVPLLDTNELLPTDPPLHRLLIRSGSTSRSKRRRTGRASSSKAVVDSNDEAPLSGAQVKEDLAAVRKRLGSDFTPIPSNTALEVEMLSMSYAKSGGRLLDYEDDEDSYGKRVGSTYGGSVACCF